MIRRLTILSFSVLLSANAHADASFIALRDSKSGVERAVTCLPLFHKFRAITELALSADVRSQKLPEDIRKASNSFYQNAYRYFFVKFLMQERSLEALFEDAYNVSGGASLQSRDVVSPC